MYLFKYIKDVYKIVIDVFLIRVAFLRKNSVVIGIRSPYFNLN